MQTVPSKNKYQHARVSAVVPAANTMVADSKRKMRHAPGRLLRAAGGGGVCQSLPSSSTYGMRTAVGANPLRANGKFQNNITPSARRPCSQQNASSRMDSLPKLTSRHWNVALSAALSRSRAAKEDNFNTRFHRNPGPTVER